ncbi:hypothetical protein [Klebsiella quasipneumoniae]|uniref:hypothetical protein n=1 Tax=Klebsiella quasipneumoniae TaxID=1463165 RepID=UPI001645CF06|nr:hypothetical protein [Klebsiella quasipneumoniae]HBQ2311561.1 hypothetical protein [Klebsiella variicola]HCI6016947.1 hypothetical protein [Klebsiella quasipneumoniae subsp. similipneumoniae]MBC4316155.1 hypothetical protein [Klebsiella quasipneumoniae]UTA44627.1 hypothetical protein J6597_06175 [Klebsiella quasipneumoniae]HBT1978634.1 hypothetical protein [Klebsiella quasipneumoniae]
MKIEELVSFCSDVRQAIELAAAQGIHNENTSFGKSDFPSGCCGDTTDLLAFLIYEKFGVMPLHRSGTYWEHIKPDSRLRDGNNHAWLELSGMIIDLTADQFNDRGFDNPAVMITKCHKFHDLFSDRDIRYNSDTPRTPKFDTRLTKSLWFIQEKLHLSGW